MKLLCFYPVMFRNMLVLIRHSIVCPVPKASTTFPVEVVCWTRTVTRHPGYALISYLLIASGKSRAR